MAREIYSLEQIRDFWTQQAIKYKTASAASWSDEHVIEMEIRQILLRLQDGDRVLDVGCANGFSTIQFAAQKNVHVRGLDYIPEMIEQARQRAAELSSKLQGSLEFDVGDITDLKIPAALYDKVVVVRVIINLKDWDIQKRALHGVAGMLKPGGMLLLSEATLQGWQRLNKMRNEWGLPDIPMPPFNCYLDQDQVARELSSEMDLVEIVDYASSYFVGTRVLKPLLAKAVGATIDVADPLMEWNRWFSQLPAVGDYGTQKLLVFQKKFV